MSDKRLEIEPPRRRWMAFWCMLVQQAQSTLNDTIAQFTLLSLGGAIAFLLVIPVGSGVDIDIQSFAVMMVVLPVILFAPLAGWFSDRFSKRDILLGASIFQTLSLAGICGAVAIRSLPLTLVGFFALAVQGAFCSPAKIGITKELVGSRYLGFAASIQQMTAMLAILSGWLVADWLFDQRFLGQGGGTEVAWSAALLPLMILTLASLFGIALAVVLPRVEAQGKLDFTPRLAISHFANLGELWQDVPLRRASFGVAFFWSFAAFIHLWAINLGKATPGGFEGFRTSSSLCMVATSLGMAAGFGSASILLRKRIELGWVPVAGIAMTLSSITLAFIPTGGGFFLSMIGFLGFSSAVFLAPLTAWMQDRFPAEKRGKMQAAVNLQASIAGILAVVAVGLFEYIGKLLLIPESIKFRLEISFVGIICGLVTLSVLRLLPGDFIRLIGGIMIRSLYRIEVVNPERIPSKGGALLLPNHVTFADALFISAACPRPVRFVMDEAFMNRASIRLFVSIFDTVTIRRDQPREAIRITIDALKNGDLVCLFPEGQLTRTGTLNELRRGFELIAKKAGHPLIPMWCDGSWGSIFSFERGRYFSKRPYRLPYGMTIAFGNEILPADANLELVRQGLLKASGTAVGSRFQTSIWERRIPKGLHEFLPVFTGRSEFDRRRIWINGYQIGQINALQRQQPFMGLSGDSTLADLSSIGLTFPELFESQLKIRGSFDGSHGASWVGGDQLRNLLEHTQLSHEVIFYDFGGRALEPICRSGLTHCPCLAVDGIVISMSMPDPSTPNPDSEVQRGCKQGTWGKLLPGWYLLASEADGLLAHGPAAPPSGLALPAKCFLDSEGFLTAGKSSQIHSVGE